jgi:cytochrome P450
MQHIEQISEQRRRTPRDDLISALCAAEDQGDKLNGDELAGMVLLLLAAGNLTTTTLIGNAVALLLDHPDQWRRVLGDDNLVPSALEEVLRFAPSILMTIRKCATDVVFGDRQIPAGSQLFGLTGAANRDPRRFPDPDAFDIGRNDRRHLSFALGIHTCLGAALARMEADVALRALLRRFPNMASGATPRQQRSGVAAGGFDQLPIVLR